MGQDAGIDLSGWRIAPGTHVKAADDTSAANVQAAMTFVPTPNTSP
jgi:hypothetical protein